jgi:hypothetical protein
MRTGRRPPQLDPGEGRKPTRVVVAVRNGYFHIFRHCSTAMMTALILIVEIKM